MVLLVAPQGLCHTKNDVLGKKTSLLLQQTLGLVEVINHCLVPLSHFIYFDSAAF